jgi:hypothetical protein
VVTAIIGSKGSVAGLVSLLRNLAAQRSGVQGILLKLETGRGERYLRGRGEIL